jgi:putative phosphonate metabolism protein
MSERYAIFYAPPTTSPLWLRAAQWLGRDAAGGILSADIPGIDPARRLALTESARRYGFHATMKAPMVLPEHQTVSELDANLTQFGLTHWPVSIGTVAPRLLGDFLALMPVEQPDELTDLAAEVVKTFEPFRAPLDAADRNRRLNAELTERQVRLVERYGYPYVLEQFLFHMTLTDRLVNDDRDAVIAAATQWFAPVLDKPVIVDRLTLFHEPQRGAVFNRLGDYPLLSQARL